LTSNVIRRSKITIFSQIIFEGISTQTISSLDIQIILEVDCRRDKRFHVTAKTTPRNTIIVVTS